MTTHTDAIYDDSEDCNCGLPNPHPGDPFKCPMHGPRLDAPDHKETYTCWNCGEKADVGTPHACETGR